MTNVKKILAITGIRSEFDILLPVLNELKRSPEFDLGIVACGTHLVGMYGRTVQLIEKEGFNIVQRIDYLLSSNTDAGRAKGLSILLHDLVGCVEGIRPDFLLVVGDREESIATGIVGNYLKIPVIHIGGGDEAINNADDPIRHATSKLAHIHCATCERYKENLIRMGEEEFRVFNVGNPVLTEKKYENIVKEELSSLLEFDLGDDPEPFLLVLQHPLSSESDQSYNQMKETMKAVDELQMKCVVIYPNSDPGSTDIIRAIEEYQDNPFIKIIQNLDRIRYVNSLYYANCLIGNSSSGLLEAQFLKKPVVNVGNRQKGRHNAGNVIFIPHDKNIIIEIINKLVYDKKYLKMIIDNIDQYYYGDGNSVGKIIEVIRKINPLDSLILNKKNSWN